MKVESRGKYPGVKVHLDPEECEIILTLLTAAEPEGEWDDIDTYYPEDAPMTTAVRLVKKMGKKIKEKQEETPNLLTERSPEEVAAILAKEVEKASLQLAQVKSGKDWKKVDPAVLTEKLLKHVKQKD